VLHEVPPFVFRSIGLASASLLLLSVALMLRRRLAVSRSSWFPLLMAGTFNIAGFNIFTAFAQLNTTTSRAAILTYTMPIWSTLLAALFLGERFTSSGRRLRPMFCGLPSLSAMRPRHQRF
jgi:drug/metabolite transporter (DMT)-like permease